MRRDQPETPADDAISPIIHRFYPPAQNSARRNMWAGVIACGIIIVVLWGWGMKLQIERISWKRGSDAALTATAQQNWNDAFSAGATASGTAQTSIRAQLHEVVNALIATGSPTSTTSTNTTSTVATSTTTLINTSTPL